MDDARTMDELELLQLIFDPSSEGDLIFASYPVDEETA